MFVGNQEENMSHFLANVYNRVASSKAKEEQKQELALDELISLRLAELWTAQMLSSKNSMYVSV